MQEQKTALLLGGTGAMGVYLAPELRSLGYQVIITSRKARTSEDAGISYLTGNAKDQAFLSRILERKYDVIVDFMIYKTPEFRERYTQLLNAAKQYIFVSSYRVYGDNQGKPITEDAPRLLDSVQDQEYLKTDEYALTKARQEDILRASGEKNWTIVRPAITYSRDRFQLGTMEAGDFVRRALAGKPVIFPRQMLDKQATLSWAGDVAKLIGALALNPGAMGQIYTVSTAEHHSWEEILKIYTQLLDMQVRLVDLKTYEQVMGGPYQIRYDRMLDRVIDNGKILAITGMRQESFMPLRQGLEMELEQFRKNPVYPGYRPDKDARMDQALNQNITSGPLATLRRKCRTVCRLIRSGAFLPELARRLKKR